MQSIKECPQWQELQAHQKKISAISLNDLFLQDSQRAERFNVAVSGLYLDYSKNHIDQQAVDLLIQLAQSCHLPEKISALFNGGIVNQSEQKPALHTALRNLSESPIYVEGENVMPLIHSVWDKMKTVIAQVRQEKYLGYSGKPIRDVVNIGVGGSHWGPLLLYNTFITDVTKIRCHFISNLDEAAFLNVMRYLNPETTLFVVSSKSFTTEETMENFQRAKRWLISAASSEHAMKHQLLAVTANIEKARELGFMDKHIFALWPWVGGRYSVWSAVGLSAAIAIGWDRFYEFLSGAYAMDQHFQQAELCENMPVLLALLSIWYNNFFGTDSFAIIPYSQCLASLPGYLQQLHMESLGKSCQQNGAPVDYSTGVICFGDAGTDSQHSFHQLFFQGTSRVRIDFILPLKNPYNNRYQLQMIANCIGQSKVLMQGYHEEQIHQDLIKKGLNAKAIESLIPHKIILGNIPTNTIIMNDLKPQQLGALLALYEHKTFVQSVIWNIDAFDQGGVERGKYLAKDLLSDLKSKRINPTWDASTQFLLKLVLQSI